MVHTFYQHIHIPGTYTYLEMMNDTYLCQDIHIPGTNKECTNERRIPLDDFNIES